MAFNPDPNKQANEVLFSCKTKKVDYPPIFFNGFPVVQVKETKHLGLVLQFKLNFQKHLYEKIKKEKMVIGQMYKSLVRPHLDYCDIIYSWGKSWNFVTVDFPSCFFFRFVSRNYFRKNIAPMSLAKIWGIRYFGLIRAN